VSASSDAAAYRNNRSNHLRGRSSSPGCIKPAPLHQHNPQTQVETTTSVETKEGVDQTQKITTTNTTISTHQPLPITRNLDNEEPIRLSKFSGGYEPDPQTPHKIESLDWPAPPYPAAVPELRARSRSSSNRQAASTVHSVHGTSNYNSDDSDEDEDNDEQEADGAHSGQYVSDNYNELSEALKKVNGEHQHQSSTTAGDYQSSINRQSTGAPSVASSSSKARMKAIRPNSKSRYQNSLFDNDYDDYVLIHCKSDKEWRKHLNKKRNARNQSGESSGVELNKSAEIEEDDDDENSNKENDQHDSPKHMDPKLKREIEEMSKIENESSMAHALLNEIKVHWPNDSGLLFFCCFCCYC
jgi:hypothetical protein